MWRNLIEGSVYKAVVRPIMFRLSAEDIHEKMISFGHLCGESKFMKRSLRLFFDYQDERLAQTVAGMKFINPVGLAAGFDKNGQIIKVLPYIGMSYGEFGSVTLNSHVGNPRPYMHRLKRHQSLVVHYGLKNDGVGLVTKRLEKAKQGMKDFVVGISVAAASPPHEKDKKDVIIDVVRAMKTASMAADYLTINISCPNIYNAPDFLNSKNLDELLKAVKQEKLTQPIFLKLSPDITDRELELLVAVAKKNGVTGFIAGNLTKDREKLVKDEQIPIPGGLSGKLTRDKSDQLIEKLYRLTQGKMIIIGCGGISSAEDAYRKIGLGANLLQLITGMIYEGPELVSEINWGIVRKLEQDGHGSVSEAVGRLVKL